MNRDTSVESALLTQGLSLSSMHVRACAHTQRERETETHTHTLSLGRAPFCWAEHPWLRHLPAPQKGPKLAFPFSLKL